MVINERARPLRNALLAISVDALFLPQFAGPGGRLEAWGFVRHFRLLGEDRRARH